MNQQDIERYYFEQFRQTYRLPQGEITYDDKPDVRIAGTQLGIEITNFYVTAGTSPASEQVQSKLRKFAVAEGQELYLQKGGRNVELTFGFDKTHPIQDARALSRQLAELGVRLEGFGNGEVRKDDYSDIPELEFVFLNAHKLQYSDEPDPKYPNGVPDSSGPFTDWADYFNRRSARAEHAGKYIPFTLPAKWRVMQSHSVEFMSTTRLNEIIAEKEAKAQQYAPCDAYWLLIVVDFINPAQEQEIRVGGVTVHSDMFQKIILYRTGYEHFVEFEPKRKLKSARSE